MMQVSLLGSDETPLCKCGCGDVVKWNSVFKRYNTFIHTHSSRGKNNYKWKGGYTDKDGRFWVLTGVKEHKARARIVMEQYLGRDLLSTEVVHHKNEIKDDDRLENLQLFETQAEHISLHMKNKIVSTETRKKMSESGKTKIFSKEHRKNISKSKKGRILSQETKDKIAEKAKIRYHTLPPELRISHKGYYKKR